MPPGRPPSSGRKGRATHVVESRPRTSTVRSSGAARRSRVNDEAAGSRSEPAASSCGRAGGAYGPCSWNRTGPLHRGTAATATGKVTCVSTSASVGALERTRTWSVSPTIAAPSTETW